MSIIEKLGIKPIKMYVDNNGDVHVNGKMEVRELEQQRNEMLEALIELQLIHGIRCSSSGISDLPDYLKSRLKSAG